MSMAAAPTFTPLKESVVMLVGWIRAALLPDGSPVRVRPDKLLGTEKAPYVPG